MTMATDQAPSASNQRPVAPAIDRDKLRTTLRRLGTDYVFAMLDGAIDLLTPRKLAKLVGQYIDLRQLQPDPEKAAAGKTSLLADVRTFDSASRGGKYHESFFMNSQNHMTRSPGTVAFIGEFNRLLDRCVARTSKADSAETREAFDILFALLAYIDECNDDVIFFADESGAWQVGVWWDRVFPAWFRCLSRTASPDEYARIVLDTVDKFERHDRGKHFATASKIGTAAQRRALAKAAGDRP